MSYFRSLIDQYQGRTPQDFDRVAARLKEGDSSLSIRNDIMDADDLSRLEAGKRVEAVERAIRDWRISLGTGLGLFLVAVLFVSPFHPFFWLGMGFGLAQTVAGMRGIHQYQQAGEHGEPVE